jgi:hypothetical protein
MPSNTADNTALAALLEKIEALYGKANRTWVMDRGIPTEATLARMRGAAAPFHYPVGTPKGRLRQLEKPFLELPWKAVRQSVRVELLAHQGGLYVLARSDGRMSKAGAMRRRRLKKPWRRLAELGRQKIGREQFLIKLGAANKAAGRAYGLVEIQLPKEDQAARPISSCMTVRSRRRLAGWRTGEIVPVSPACEVYCWVLDCSMTNRFIALSSPAG